jgi:hypothetical protein
VTKGGVDHISGAVAGTPIALEWLSRRLAGRGRAGAHADAAVHEAVSAHARLAA